MTALNAASAVATAMQAAGLGTVGVDIFIGQERPSGDGFPVAAYFVLSTGGPPPDDFLGDSQRRGVKHHRVQVIVRGVPGDLSAGLSAAISAHAALHHATVTGAIRCAAQQSEPVFIGTNDQEQLRWSINLVVDAVW